MKVKVIHANSRPDEESPRKYGSSWIEYWENVSLGKKIPEVCPSCGCLMSSKGGAVGGHILYENNQNGLVYITPVCDHCNKQYKGKNRTEHVFEVDESMLVVGNCDNICEEDCDNIELFIKFCK